MAFGVGGCFVAVHVEFGKAKENDLIFWLKFDFHERIVARLGRDDRVHDAGASDSLPVQVGEIRRFGAACADCDGLADEDCRTVLHVEPLGGKGRG